MRIIYRGMAISLVALSLGGWTLPTPAPTVLWSFCSLLNCSDGASPVADLVADDHGALYGTTVYGGKSGDGTVFKLTPPSKGQTVWEETVLYSFCSLSNCSDGDGPLAGLIADREGAFYGTTSGGGNGVGIVFKLTPPAKGQTVWKETVLYSFCALSSCVDGNGPLAGLIADREGALYGTTVGGGINPGSNGGGTVFKLTPPSSEGQTAWKETVLYSFTGGSDGAAPQAGLIADKHGALYTTTVAGGSGSFGTVLKLTLCPEPSGRGWREKDDDRDRDRCPAFTPEK